MWALITGASSGIGESLAYELSYRGYKLILVARNKNKLEQLSKKLNTETEIIVSDLSIEEECYKLYEKVKNRNVEIIINNAGFGLFGEFVNQDLEEELNMINLNIKAVHILTKLFLKDLLKKDSGYILNVASVAGLQPGPLMATYYSTKSYVLHLTEAISEELFRNKSNVYVGTLIPGPVDTGFNKRANVSFKIASLNSSFVAKYAIKKMFKRKIIILPGIVMKSSLILYRILPRKVVLKVIYMIQKKKGC